MKLNIARDKWRHFLVGIGMGFLLEIAFLWLLPKHPFMASAAAFVTALAISYGFELFSKVTGKGVYEIADALASIIGGLTGILLAIALLNFIG